MEEKGQITLPFILLVGGIIVEIAIAGLFTAYFLSTANLGERLSVRAGAAAYSGVQDAMVRIARDKEFGNRSYELPVQNDTADVIITKEDLGGPIYTYTIESLATAGSRRKKFEAVLVVDKISGKATLQSIKEVPAN